MSHRLLVVSDEPHLLRKLESCLSPEGFDVVTARRGREALVKVAQAVPDLIIIGRTLNDGNVFQDDNLTEREKGIAASVARGLTNKEIASEMAISVRTVENHISHILDKKSFNNRVEIARYVMEQRA